MKDCFCYFQNDKCKYYPCHKTNSGELNCLFCYCPLYALGDECGGNFKYVEGGVKDCSDCLIPHGEDGYLYIMSKIEKIKEIAKKKF